MQLETAVRLTELLLGIFFILQSCEHLNASREEKRLFFPRLVLSTMLVSGLWSQWVLLLLCLHSFLVLKKFRGAYNGGSDRMSLLVLYASGLAAWFPAAREIFISYLGIQVVLSYFMAGLYKAINPNWIKGKALKEIFTNSNYPRSAAIRELAGRTSLLKIFSYSVVILELAFPVLLFLDTNILMIGLTVAALFHLANAYFFGLNRFFWAWLAAYPALIWFHNILPSLLN